MYKKRTIEVGDLETKQAKRPQSIHNAYCSVFTALGRREGEDRGIEIKSVSWAQGLGHRLSLPFALRFI